MDFLESSGIFAEVNVCVNVYLIIVKGLSGVNPYFNFAFQSV